MKCKAVGALGAILLLCVGGALLYQSNYLQISSKKNLPLVSESSCQIDSLTEESVPVTNQKVPLFKAKNGFSSVQSIKPVEISLGSDAKLPEWLNGYLVGTGPALYDLGGTSNKYWFNGLAQLHTISLDPKGSTYRSAFLESNFYKKSITAGKFDEGFSSAKPSSSWLSKLAQACSSKEPYDNGNLAVSIIGSTCIAHTETPALISFDPITLKTIAPVTFQDQLTGHLSPARYCYDPYEDAWYGYLIEFNKTSTYHIFKLANREPLVRQEIAAISTKEPAYMRSMGITKDHLIVLEVPFVVNPLDLLFATGCFVDQVVWKPELKTKISLLSKKNGAIIGSYVTDPFYTFEIVNSFDQGSKVIIDLIKYPDVRIIKHTALEVLRSSSYPAFPSGRFTRIIIDKSTGSIQMKELYKSHGFCTFNKAQKTMGEYRYVYSLGSTQINCFPDQLLKFDVSTDQALNWSSNGCIPSAPIFVQKPGATGEDDGVLLSVVFDTIAQNSFVLVLSAADLGELERIVIPTIIPLGFNGIFLRKK